MSPTSPAIAASAPVAPRTRWTSALLPLALFTAMTACSDAGGPSVLGTDAATPAAAEPAAAAPSGSSSVVSALAGMSLFVDPASPAKKQADAWRSSRPADAAQLDKIAARPYALWLGDWLGAEPFNEVSKLTAQVTSTGAVPVYVLYNIPQRDCGLYSKGGSATAAAYEHWVAEVARGIGSHKAVAIVEPDAVPGMDCLSAADQDVRLRLIRVAIQALKALPKVTVYLDAGNAGWHHPSIIAPRLKLAGIDMADGFSLNVSNFFSNSESIRYGSDVSALVGGKHFVVDTGRAGSGASVPYEWCNPAGRSLGSAPTTSTGHPLVDAFLWVKPPGESDGECNGGPGAGKWWPEYALGLASRSNS
jgi:endoglucanase